LIKSKKILEARRNFQIRVEFYFIAPVFGLLYVKRFKKDDSLGITTAGALDAARLKP